MNKWACYYSDNPRDWTNRLAICHKIYPEWRALSILNMTNVWPFVSHITVNTIFKGLALYNPTWENALCRMLNMASASWLSQRHLQLSVFAFHVIHCPRKCSMHLTHSGDWSAMVSVICHWVVYFTRSHLTFVQGLGPASLRSRSMHKAPAKSHMLCFSSNKPAKPIFMRNYSHWSSLVCIFVGYIHRYFTRRKANDGRIQNLGSTKLQSRVLYWSHYRKSVGHPGVCRIKTP